MSKILALLGLMTFVAACDKKKDESSSNPVQSSADVAPVAPLPEVTATSVPQPDPVPSVGPTPDVEPLPKPNWSLETTQPERQPQNSNKGRK